MRTLALLALLACSACGSDESPKGPKRMSMADDWKRLNDLEGSKGTLQYGQSLQVTFAPDALDTVAVNKDLIRFVGEKTDLNAWRVYLGPHQPQPGITVTTFANETYANPTPWAPPEPWSYDSMISNVYARVQFGAGGQQHEAFVDWPRRGCVIQIGGSYVQVNAFVRTLGVSDATVLPFLRASIAPEPGGGDSVQPATYTYPKDNGNPIGGPPQRIVWNFQIPPFARAFVPILNSEALNTTINPTFTRLVFETARQADFIGTSPQQTWEFGPNERLPMEPFPLAGQDIGNLRVEMFVDAPYNGYMHNLGMMFYLDL